MPCSGWVPAHLHGCLRQPCALCHSCCRLSWQPCSMHMHDLCCSIQSDSHQRHCVQAAIMCCGCSAGLHGPWTCFPDAPGPASPSRDGRCAAAAAFEPKLCCGPHLLLQLGEEALLGAVLLIVVALDCQRRGAWRERGFPRLRLSSALLDEVLEPLVVHIVLLPLLLLLRLQIFAVPALT